MAAIPLLYAPSIIETVPTRPRSVAGRHPTRLSTAKASPAAQVTTTRQRITEVTVPILNASRATTAAATPVPTRRPVLPPTSSADFLRTVTGSGGPPPVTSGV